MRRAFLLALAAVVLAAAGCGSSKSSSTSSSSASSSASSSSASPSSGAATKAAPTGPPVVVTMKNLAFVPKSIHATVGQTAKWVNQDTAPHNVTYVSGPKFASSPQVMNTGATFSVKLTQPGTIHYFCSIHPFMKATITVTQ